MIDVPVDLAEDNEEAFEVIVVMDGQANCVYIWSVSLSSGSIISKAFVVQPFWPFFLIQRRSDFIDARISHIADPCWFIALLKISFNDNFPLQFFILFLIFSNFWELEKELIVFAFITPERKKKSKKKNDKKNMNYCNE